MVLTFETVEVLCGTDHLARPLLLVRKAILYVKRKNKTKTITKV